MPDGFSDIRFARRLPSAAPPRSRTAGRTTAADRPTRARTAAEIGAGNIHARAGRTTDTRRPAYTRTAAGVATGNIHARAGRTTDTRRPAHTRTAADVATGNVHARAGRTTDTRRPAHTRTAADVATGNVHARAGRTAADGAAVERSGQTRRGYRRRAGCAIHATGSADRAGPGDTALDRTIQTDFGSPTTGDAGRESRGIKGSAIE